MLSSHYDDTRQKNVILKVLVCMTIGVLSQGTFCFGFSYKSRIRSSPPSVDVSTSKRFRSGRRRSSSSLNMVLRTPEEIFEQTSTVNLLDGLLDESVRTSSRRPIIRQFDPSSGWVSYTCLIESYDLYIVTKLTSRNTIVDLETMERNNLFRDLGIVCKKHDLCVHNISPISEVATYH